MTSDGLPSLLGGWESFYVIVGSSGAALTGLQFVVIALIADSKMARSIRAIDAFGTPTVVHFCAVLLVSAIMSAPWRSLSSVAIVLGAIGLTGVVYACIVIRRAHTQTGYQPVLEDWIWHAALPLVAYAGMLVSALVLRRGPVSAMFMVAATTLLLLFIGIHNAWDSVTYVAVEGWNDGKSDQSGA